MIDSIYTILDGREYMDFDSLKIKSQSEFDAESLIKSYNLGGDRFVRTEQCDLPLFIMLSRYVLDYSEYTYINDPEPVTLAELKNIENWWNENGKYISPDFIDDMLRAYCSTQLTFPYRIQEKRQRISERLEYRKSKEMWCENDSVIWGNLSYSWNCWYPQFDINELKVHLYNMQKQFNMLQINLVGDVDAILLSGRPLTFIYAIKKVMGQEYVYGKALSIREFECIKDWLFVHGCDEKLEDEIKDAYFEGLKTRPELGYPF